MTSPLPAAIRTFLLLLSLAFVAFLASPTPVMAAEPGVDGPFTLTDPQGQGLILERLAVRSAVHGMLSMTEYELTFRNPQDRVIEGRFKAVLPQGATLSRLAKEVKGQLMEGEVVERLRAQQIYQEILHSMRDPALLEQDQGNSYSVKIFPIEARGQTRILISYSELLPLKNGQRVLHIPIEGLPEIGHFSFEGVFSPLPGERYVGDDVSLHAKNFTPRESLKFGFKADAKAPKIRALSSGDFVLVSMQPEMPITQAPPRGTLLFYIDTSASSAAMMARRGETIAALFQGLPERQRVEIWAFDQGITRLFEGKAGDGAAMISQRLETRGYMGATDLNSLLRHIEGRAAKDPNLQAILVSDGIPTFGPRDSADLLPILKNLPETARIDALPLGSRFDGEMLNSLSAAGRGRVLPLSLGSSMEGALPQVIEGILTPPGVTLELGSDGSEWVYPSRFNDVAPGDEIILLAKAAPGDTIELTLDGAPLPLKAPVAIGPQFAPLLEREAWAAYLGHLEMRRQSESDAAIARAITQERVRLSEAHRVLIPETTLLVLESEADYRRYGLERRALADILVVGERGVERLGRQDIPTPQPILRPDIPQASTEILQKDEAEKKKEQASAEDVTMNHLDIPQAKGFLSEAEMNAEPQRGASTGAAPGSAPALSMEERDRGQLRRRRPQAQPMADAPPPPTDGASNQTFGGSRSYGAGGGGVSGSIGGSESLIALEGLAVEGEDEAIAEEPRLIAPAPQGSRPLADWVVAGQRSPTKDDIRALSKAVAQSPLDRIRRLQLADALTKAEAWEALRTTSLQWQQFDGENPKIYESLMLAYHNLNQPKRAQRAAGSLIDIAPSTPEALVHAAYVLMYCGGDERIPELLEVALKQRPDYPNTYRALAIYFERAGAHNEAAQVLERALGQTFPSWYGDVERVLREELSFQYQGMLNAGAEPASVAARQERFDVKNTPASPLRITLTWNTDANDVDLHAIGPDGSECSYQNMVTPSLHLYEDITQGFGPEVMISNKAMSGSYHIGVNYFSAGPMGVSRGVVVVRQEGEITQLLPFGLIPQDDDMAYLTSIKL